MRMNAGWRSRLGGSCAAVSVLVLGAIGAGAADMGGTYWPALGLCRISVARDGAGPVREDSNLRLQFDGDTGDASGTGHLYAYDEIGQVLLHQVPFTWTTGRGRAFRFEPSKPELGEFLVQNIVENEGGVPLLAIENVSARGTVRRAGESVAFVIRVAGEASMDGAPPRKFRASIRGR